jgi:hypothetical protein
MTHLYANARSFICREYRAAVVIDQSGEQFPYNSTLDLPYDPLNHQRRLREAQLGREWRRLHLAAAALARGGA